VTTPTPARTAALDVLRAVRAGALAGRAFDAAVGHLDVRDRAWVRELVFGVFRLRGRLDHLLAARSRRPLARVDPDVLDILRLGAYQLTEMGGVPDYAAVSQSVELARRVAGRGAGGFVNGVLQSLRRAGADSTFPDFDEDAVGHLVTWGSHPEWLVRRWIARYGATDARRLVEADNTRPELFVRALGNVADTAARLREAGVMTEPVAAAPRALRIVSGDVDAALSATPLIVQDPAAGLVVSYAGAPAGARIIDLAAAPGGKALALAHDGEADPELVVAADVSPERLRRLEDNVRRLAGPPPAGAGTTALRVVVADGRRPPFRPVDVVLLDAPCTGTGTFRRHPDGRWRITPRDLRALAALQAELLDAAACLVASRGLLVYSTCSLEPEENEEQVTAFLKRHPDFATERGPDLPGGVVGADDLLRVLPHEHGWDGAFAARLRRNGASHAR
jgi:16S rRNA (cytosine967-C5)-methyltransferase